MPLREFCGVALHPGEFMPLFRVQDSVGRVVDSQTKGN